MLSIVYLIIKFVYKWMFQQLNKFIMKRVIILMTFFIYTGMFYGQENETPIQKGTVLTLGKPSYGLDYRYIDFPKRNIIIKKGAIANFNNLVGKKVKVENVIFDKQGTTKTILKRNDGLHFFRFFPIVKADLKKAIAAGELNSIK